MELYARINILGGRAVRLPRGDVSSAIALDADPIARAQGWIDKGVGKLLIVDLDAAARRDYSNRELIHRMIGAVDVPMLVAGGVRSLPEVERLLGAGAARVVMGTVALTDQVMTWEICRNYPSQIMIALDVKPDEELVSHGWTEHSGRYLEETIIELDAAGAIGMMITEAGRDALSEPPNESALCTALANTDHEEIVAAGGVRDLDDLRSLKALEVDGRFLAGVVVGREVTEGRFTIEEAAAVLAP